jgi:hypothetical protein
MFAMTPAMTPVGMDANEDLRLALRRLYWKVHLLRRFRVIRNRTEASSLDRQRDTSRSSFPENRFPNTGDCRSRPHRYNRERLKIEESEIDPKIGKAIGNLRQVRNPASKPPLLSLLLSRTTNPSLPALKRRHDPRSGKNTTMRSVITKKLQSPRQRLWIGTANFIGETSSEQ